MINLKNHFNNLNLILCKKNLKIYVIILTVVIGFFGCEEDSIEERAIKQNKLSTEMEAFQKQLVGFDSSFSSKNESAKANQEFLFIEASRNLLLANGVTENEINEMMKQDKGNMVKMAMSTFFENKSLINQ